MEGQPKWTVALISLLLGGIVALVSGVWTLADAKQRQAAELAELNTRLAIIEVQLKQKPDTMQVLRMIYSYHGKPFGEAPKAPDER